MPNFSRHVPLIPHQICRESCTVVTRVRVSALICFNPFGPDVHVPDLPNVTWLLSLRQVLLNFPQIGILAADLQELELPILEDKVIAAINDLPSEKAPSPDGYTGMFFRMCCSIIKDDVMAAVN